MTTNTDSQITTLLDGDLTVEAISSLVKLGFDFSSTPPSDYRVEAHCTRCGHKQYPYAVNPVFEDTPEGRVMVQCFVGSSGDFCDRCEDAQAGLPDDAEVESCMTMELVGYGLASAYENEDGIPFDCLPA